MCHLFYTHTVFEVRFAPKIYVCTGLRIFLTLLSLLQRTGIERHSNALLTSVSLSWDSHCAKANILRRNGLKPVLWNWTLQALWAVKGQTSQFGFFNSHNWKQTLLTWWLFFFWLVGWWVGFLPLKEIGMLRSHSQSKRSCASPSPFDPRHPQGQRELGALLGAAAPPGHSRRGGRSGGSGAGRAALGSPPAPGRMRRRGCCRFPSREPASRISRGVYGQQ